MDPQSLFQNIYANLCKMDWFKKCIKLIIAVFWCCNGFAATNTFQFLVANWNSLVEGFFVNSLCLKLVKTSVSISIMSNEINAYCVLFYIISLNNVIHKFLYTSEICFRVGKTSKVFAYLNKKWFKCQWYAQEKRHLPFKNAFFSFSDITIVTASVM